MLIGLRAFFARRKKQRPGNEILNRVLYDPAFVPNKHQAIDALKAFYYHYLVEDPIDGTGFDGVVFSVLSSLQQAYLVSTQDYWQVETRGKVVNSFSKTDHGYRQAMSLIQEINGEHDRHKVG